MFIFHNHIVNDVIEQTHSGLTWNKHETWENHMSHVINIAVKCVDMMKSSR